MRGLFDPVVAEIIKMIASQVKLTQSTKDRTVDRLILVGGFGDSEYLYDVVRTWCNERNIQVSCPTDCQAAIVKGAALRGLEGLKPTTTRSRRHYGFTLSQRFREGIDDPKHAYLDRWDDTRRCKGRMSWVISKGDALTDKTKATSHLKKILEQDEDSGHLTLYSCDADKQPGRVEEPGVKRIGEIRHDYSLVNKSTLPSKIKFDTFKTTVYKVAYNVDILFGQKEGVLKFESRTDDGHLIGRTAIQFDGDEQLWESMSQLSTQDTTSGNRNDGCVTEKDSLTHTKGRMDKTPLRGRRARNMNGSDEQLLDHGDDGLGRVTQKSSSTYTRGRMDKTRRVRRSSDMNDLDEKWQDHGDDVRARRGRFRKRLPDGDERS